MTNAEAIRKLKDILEEAIETEDAICYVTSVDEEPLRMAIEALEKQDKIKTIMLTKGGEHKYRALMDCQRQLIYDRWITAEMASALGWNWSDEE